jgi:hypothetical protein
LGLSVRDAVVPRVADTLTTAQGADGEAAEDKDQDMVCEDAHSLHLVGDLIHLDRHTLIKWKLASYLYLHE